MKFYRHSFLSLALFSISLSSSAWAEPTIEVVPNKGAAMSESAVIEKVKSQINLERFQSVKAQVVSNTPGIVDSILVYLKAGDKVISSSIPVDKFARPREKIAEDLPENRTKQKTLAETTTVFCPDESVQFLSVSHRKLPRDQKAANEVADAAEKAGWNTIRLLKNQATRQNFLNYLSCPGLVADFYDGDSNPNELETYDIPISSQDISMLLKGAFRNRVTHVWVACSAFNNPMLSAMVDDAQSQKYIAGIVPLATEHADQTGVCTMEAALQGQSISKSLQDCRAQNGFRLYNNKWGIGGNGSDFLGH